MTNRPAADEVWLLTGNRAGEIAQQRALAAALAMPVREVQVARMAPVGRPVSFDFSALRPPWPRLAISFGKTLVAALHLRGIGGGAIRLVHLGLPRKTAVGALDLIVPMPTDRYVDAPNVLRIGMPLNVTPPLAVDSPVARRLRAAALPRPWVALIVGGPTTRLRLEPREIERIAEAADARARALGGSLLATTSPRTPAEAIAILRRTLGAPGELHPYAAGASAANPYAAYLHLADELIVTGDSASMIAECWRSAKPLWVAPLGMPARRRFMRGLRRAVPRALVASGTVAADVDVGRWIAQLAKSGKVGLLGGAAPTVAYRVEDDDDLPRLVSRIGELLGRSKESR